MPNDRHTLADVARFLIDARTTAGLDRRDDVDHVEAEAVFVLIAFLVRHSLEQSPTTRNRWRRDLDVFEAKGIAPASAVNRWRELLKQADDGDDIIVRTLIRNPELVETCAHFQVQLDPGGLPRRLTFIDTDQSPEAVASRQRVADRLRRFLDQ